MSSIVTWRGIDKGPHAESDGPALSAFPIAWKAIERDHRVPVAAQILNRLWTEDSLAEYPANHIGPKQTLIVQVTQDLLIVLDLALDHMRILRGSQLHRVDRGHYRRMESAFSLPGEVANMREPFEVRILGPDFSTDTLCRSHYQAVHHR